MPVARKAASEGAISAEHLAEIEWILSQAPKSLSAEQRASDEETLVRLARTASSGNVRRAALRSKSYWDLDDKEPKDREDELARPRRETRYWFSRAGRFKLTSDLDADARKLIAVALDTLAKPDAADEEGNPDPRTREQRLGDAMVQVFDTATRTDAMPAKAGEQAIVMVTVTLEELERRAGIANLEGWGAVSATELLKMCCDARIVPAVMGSDGQVLHLGRSQRHANRAQRHALAIRDKGCSRPGCTRSPNGLSRIMWPNGSPTPGPPTSKTSP